MQKYQCHQYMRRYDVGQFHHRGHKVGKQWQASL